MKLCIRTRDQLAVILGLSVRQTGRLIRAGVIQRESNGEFDLCKVIPSLFSNYRYRLRIASRLCKDYLPFELQRRLLAEGIEEMD